MISLLRDLNDIFDQGAWLQGFWELGCRAQYGSGFGSRIPLSNSDRPYRLRMITIYYSKPCSTSTWHGKLFSLFLSCGSRFLVNLGSGLCRCAPLGFYLWFRFPAYPALNCFTCKLKRSPPSPLNTQNEAR